MSLRRLAEMMIVHDGQAVRMSRTLVAKRSIPERVDNIAEFIVHDQTGSRLGDCARGPGGGIHDVPET